ncbi:hypothetical protein OG535_29310 [Kitasatospora sp. NBC_00085]|uniref:hypothetical protein n=1 Tax=unclassified Kitasatospora TaxID=2633591 RepID=UPI00324EFBBC
MRATAKALDFGVDPKKPGVRRVLHATEIELGIACAPLSAVDFGYEWGLLTSGRDKLDECERVLGRKILVEPRLPWASGDHPGRDGFVGYVMRLIGSLKQKPLGKQLLEDIGKLLPVPNTYIPDSPFDFANLSGGWARHDRFGHNEQVLEEPPGADGRPGRDSGVRVLILNGGPDLRNTWVLGGNEVNSGDGKGAWVVISFPWGRILQAEGFLLRPDILLGNLLNRAVGILSGAADDRPVDIPVSWKPWEYRTVRTTVSEAIALGAEVPLRYIQAGFKDVGVFSQAPIRQPALVTSAAGMAAKFLIAVNSAPDSPEVRDLKTRMLGTEAARRRAWTVNEAKLSEEHGLPSRLSARQVGTDLYWEHQLLRDPTTMTAEVVRNPKTATAAGFIGSRRLLFDVTSKADLAWAVLVALEVPLQKGITALLDLFSLGTMGESAGRIATLLMPSNLYKVANTARWVETFVLQPLLQQQTEEFLLGAGVGAVAAVDALLGGKIEQFAGLARKVHSGASAKADFAERVKLKDDKENSRRRLIRDARAGHPSPEPPPGGGSKVADHLQMGAAFVYRKAADQVPGGLPVPSLEQIQVGCQRLGITKGNAAFSAEVERYVAAHRGYCANINPALAAAVFGDPTAKLSAALGRKKETEVFSPARSWSPTRP